MNQGNAKLNKLIKEHDKKYGKNELRNEAKHEQSRNNEGIVRAQPLQGTITIILTMTVTVRRQRALKRGNK